MGEDLSAAMMDRLLYVLMEREVPDISAIKRRFAMIFNDYRIEPKETALTVYTEGKNEYFIKRFILAKATAGCSKRTLETYSQGLRLLLPEIGKDADTITGSDLQILIARLLSRMTPVGAEHYRLTLSSFFSWMYKEELIRKNPMNKIEKIKQPKTKKLAFTEMDVELLRSACKNAREKALVEILLSTGCRASEIVSIRLIDIGEDGTIEVLGKGNKTRNVYLNAKAKVAFSAYLAERKDTNPFLFPKCRYSAGEAPPEMKSLRSDWYKHPEYVDAITHMDSSSSVNGILHGIGKRAGVENVHAHRFRRTCATFALRRGMPIEQVSKMLGHEQISTTQIYLDLTERDLAQAHEKYVV